MLHSKILPQTSTKFTQIYLPYLWHFATLILGISWGCLADILGMPGRQVVPNWSRCYLHLWRSCVGARSWNSSDTSLPLGEFWHVNTLKHVDAINFEISQAFSFHRNFVQFRDLSPWPKAIASSKLLEFTSSSSGLWRPPKHLQLLLLPLKHTYTLLAGLWKGLMCVLVGLDMMLQFMLTRVFLAFGRWNPVHVGPQ